MRLPVLARKGPQKMSAEEIDRLAGRWGIHEAPDFESFPQDLKEARARNPHLDTYLTEWTASGKELPRYQPFVPHDVADEEWDSLLYPVGDPVFIHILPDPQMGRSYLAIEPDLDEEGLHALETTKNMVFRRARYFPPPKGPRELAATVNLIFDRFVHEGPEVRLPEIRGSEGAEPTGKEALKELLEEMRPQVALPRHIREAVRYRLLRDLVASGPLEPVMRDPYIEDIHSIGAHDCFVIHKLFGMIPSNVKFRDEAHADEFVENLAERIGRPVSESQPIVDATLVDGSRINIIYSDSISRRGPSFSIRRVAQDPVPITRLIQWGTISARMAAYVWLCLENGMSIFVCGDAACGKTTTLNAIMSFVKARDKIYTAEDTPEVIPPHPVWQRLMTRESGPEEGRVQMFDLLKAALRSRPNYIVVGEIRGAEGAVAFQAMQTGHPCIASFHAASIQKMIQRLTSAPIHVPLTFIDNLNVAIIQQVLHRNGRLIRRITDITEIEGYSSLDGGVLTRPVFTYDPQVDRHTFRGRNNSHILEKKIAETLGYADPRMIYDDLDERARVLEAMVREEIWSYDEVNQIVDTYVLQGVTGLPFTI